MTQHSNLRLPGSVNSTMLHSAKPGWGQGWSTAFFVFENVISETVFNFENTPGVLHLFSVRVNSLWCWINFLSKLPLQPSNCHSGLPRTASARATRMRAPSAKRLPKALDEHWCHDYNQIRRLSGYESSHSYHWLDLTAHIAKTGCYFVQSCNQTPEKGAQETLKHHESHGWVPTHLPVFLHLSLPKAFNRQKYMIPGM